MVKVTRRKQNKPNKKKEISIRRRKKCSRIVIKDENENENDNRSDEFDKLPIDVLTCIFLKCGLKTLSISRCVSKSWNDCIISPLFVFSRRKQEGNAPEFLFVETSRYLPRSSKSKLQFVSLDMDGRNEDLYTILNYPDTQIHCNGWTVSAGLVCLSTACRIYLCNPAIHQLRELPNSSPSATPGYEHFGFGYLPSKKEYKVLHFFYLGPPRGLALEIDVALIRCEVFTLSSSGGISNGRWKEIAEQPPYHPIFRGVLVNECLYWLGKDKIVYVGQPRIMSFDFENEKFISLGFPSASMNCHGLNLMDLKGSLCVADRVNFRKSSILDLWILKDKVRCVWAKEYSIDFGVRFDPMTLDCFHSTWNEEIVFRQEVGAMMIIFFYDIKRKTFRQVQRHRAAPISIYWKTCFSLDA
ncbi:putative F-box protein At1g19160 isoform X2 [Solanum pennellii]|uniref:F-box protein At1g19160 isoform X2 n=1 Tax=Solanum pennellii TaxID=28526 RepID=A0ABM1VI37_SOLPN|nr:putative F-box protein At1g19160 isoform X2 [Solanum pennellii]